MIVKIRPDTTHLPQGWKEANANELSGGENPDPLAGFPNLKSPRYRIQKLERAGRTPRPRRPRIMEDLGGRFIWLALDKTD
jgi:hypothetical protein